MGESWDCVRSSFLSFSPFQTRTLSVRASLAFVRGLLTREGAGP